MQKLGFATTTLAKFAKNEHVSGETLEKLCAYFNCQFSDIVEYIPEK
jgi:DNA-binding Xre family transcriptional regulator